MTVHRRGPITGTVECAGGPTATTPFPGWAPPLARLRSTTAVRSPHDEADARHAARVHTRSHPLSPIGRTGFDHFRSSGPLGGPVVKSSCMATRRCMNAACGVTEPGGEWRMGWGLRSGGFAMLCVKCGY
ncbi:hypothetical protein BHE74_00015949 [Ensete ventricosum]|nr:hypothetical protein GW17_00014398 [Ensete ventricosum]RWW75998.1 hypothetical protein BHE74_00015949 [Ensete ventricosum]RZR86247.1 hypothetical protein BHM03_00013424 [Ensete ventricosum]